MVIYKWIKREKTVYKISTLAQAGAVGRMRLACNFAMHAMRVHEGNGKRLGWAV
jgi:hypothetical protein